MVLINSYGKVTIFTCDGSNDNDKVVTCSFIKLSIFAPLLKNMRLEELV